LSVASSVSRRSLPFSFFGPWQDTQCASNIGWITFAYSAFWAVVSGFGGSGFLGV